MVHKKYIKRGGKTFGPYLYENYRENGKTKTKYLGLGNEKNSKNWAFILGAVLLLIFILGMVGIFLTEPQIFKSDSSEGGGELSSISFMGRFTNLFATSSPLNVLVEIVVGHRPEIILPSEDIFICENNALANYHFNVSDEDGVEIWNGVYRTLNVQFVYHSPIYFNINYLQNFSEFLGEYEIISIIPEPGKFNKTYLNQKRIGENGWAVYPENILVTDNMFVVEKPLNITIIEINNKPVINSIGVRTIDVNKLWVGHPKSSLYYDSNATDLETAKEDLTFNLSILNKGGEEIHSLFDISEEGVINFTANLSHLTCGVNCSENYNVTVCVKDTGITNVHPDIVPQCSQNGGPESTCEIFGLTITDINTPPNITETYPETNETLNSQGLETLYFNITFEDEQGTIPEVYWYLYPEASLLQFNEGNLSAELTYKVPCNFGGNHTLRSVVTDGDLNDSVEWNFSVANVECPVRTDSGGGGGGGGGVGLYCLEKWGCTEWEQCKNLDEYVQNEWVIRQTVSLIEPRCAIFDWDKTFCGFQERICKDYNYCNTTFQKPGLVRECYYTENPSCEDGIQNCHEDSCEILVDCGGPCEACPTCSDGIQNQNEEGIDCGGYCDDCVELPWVPRAFKLMVTYSLIFLFILVLVLAFRQIKNYLSAKKIFQESSIKNKIIRGEKKIETNNRAINLVFVIVVLGALFAANFFIINTTSQGGINNILSGGEIGFLANYGVFSSLVRNFGVFLVSAPVFSNDGGTSLVIGDTSDNSNIVKAGEGILFYADYKYVGGSSVVTEGDCKIRFENYTENYSSWVPMDYNSFNERYELTRSFNYKGSYLFEVNCTNGTSEVNSSDEYIITNTPPSFIESSIITYTGIEDSLFFHDFNNNFTDPDVNDKWSLEINKINGFSNFEELYPWILFNRSTNILEINATTNANTNDETGVFDISMKISDTTEEGNLRTFRFNIEPRNDPPIFNPPLVNKTLIVGDLFEYVITASDEEMNVPYFFEIEQPNSLLGPGEYFTYENQLVIGLVPQIGDIGSHIINISVADTNDLGSETTYQLVNFTVRNPIWLEPLDSEYIIEEGDEFYLNLTKNVSSSQIRFVNETGFPYFNLTSEGIINFTPDDAAVGSWLLEIIADDGSVASPKIFNFTILNKNDSVTFLDFQILSGGSQKGFEINVSENLLVTLRLTLKDDDLYISKDQIDTNGVYDEHLDVSSEINGPNTSLFNFELESSRDNLETYLAEFTPINSDLGKYEVRVDVSDANKNSALSIEFNLTIKDNPYAVPQINFPDFSKEFNLKEGETPNDLIFRANHTVGDNLTYRFYINDNFKESINYFGDNRNLLWNYTPNFSEETYGDEIKNLTLNVLNPSLPDLNITRTWNLTINHTNAPVRFIGDIGDKSTPYSNQIEINLEDYFIDEDYFDPYYNQNLTFNVSSDSNLSNIRFFKGELSNFSIVLATINQRPTTETINISVSDLNASNLSQILTTAISNNFVIEFIEPEIKVITVPTSGSTTTVPISLKILMPGQISAYEGETITIPISLKNTGKKAFNGLTLNSSAFKGGDPFNEIKTSLDNFEFKTLKPGQEENLTLTMHFDTDKLGEYEVLVSASSQSPKYTDWGKIYITLKAINESQVRDLIVFMEEFIASNPECVEITELASEADEYFNSGDYNNARIKAEQALNACKETISQVSTPKLKIPYFTVSLYLVITILAALIIGLIYYFIRRRIFQKTLLNGSAAAQEKI